MWQTTALPRGWASPSPPPGSSRWWTASSLGIIVRRGQGENGGLVVEEVDPDSDCHRQGIQPQDIIVAANGQQVQTFADLERIKRTLDVGDSLLLEVLRGGEHLEFTVTLMDQDDF